MNRPATSEDRCVWEAIDVKDAVAFCRREGCEYRLEEPLARHTSLGIGGPTPLMIWPPHPEAVAATVAWLARRGLAWRILAGGTNVLVPDSGVRLGIINTTRLIDGTRIDAPRATFAAGLPTAQALRTASRNGMAGLVWSTGLPGTIGGAVAGNAGCWGGQMSDIVTGLDIVAGDGTTRTLTASDLVWSYRSLNFEEHSGTGGVIVSVTMELGTGEARALADRSKHLQSLKRARQPVGARNAGCIFKNPRGGRTAGQLIELAGCKELQIGGAEVSPLHGNFIINRADATSEDVQQLIGAIKKKVEQQSGISLEEEIRRW
ncbi:MAG: UDP-N-acetylmuramate dehydrogenase [Acidobacteriota bacterium]